MQQISKSAKVQGISQSGIIVILLKKIMKDIGIPDNIGILVQYQERRKPEEWHTFHIKWDEYDYEYSQDLRKLLKMSVSLLLAHAVKKFLSKRGKIKKSDNYQFIHYTIFKEVTINTICWRLIWSFSPALVRRL